MGRNAKRRRQRRDAARQSEGREVRTTLAERAGNRVRSVIRTVVGSDGAPPPAKPDRKANASGAADRHGHVGGGAAMSWRCFLPLLDVHIELPLFRVITCLLCQRFDTRTLEWAVLEIQLWKWCFEWRLWSRDY